MATGEVELEGQVLVLKRIHVAYSGFSFTEEQRETVERVLSVHADGCPVARSLRGAIEITTTLSGGAVWNR
jgi:uncharacterized OsmC-like protein